MISNDIVYMLEKRAEIRRGAISRKSVQEGKADRISDLLEAAALVITDLRKQLEAYETKSQGNDRAS